MVELKDLRNLLEPFLELRDLLEVVTELDDRCRLEHPLLVDDKLAVLEGVDVGLDEEQVGAGLDGEEAASGNVDTVRAVEVLDRGTSSSLELFRADEYTQNKCLNILTHTWRTA